MDAYKILKPLLFVAEIVCVIPFKFDANGKLFKPFHKSLFYYLRMILILSIVIGSIIYKQCAVTVYNSKSAVGNAVEFAHYNCRLIGTTACVLSINFFNAHITSFMNSLSKLEQQSKKNGFKINYNKISSLSYIVIIILLIKVIVMEIPYFVAAFYTNLVGILDFLIFNVPLLLIHVISLQWITYLVLLKIHIKSLNNMLKTLKYRKCWVIDDFIKAPLGVPTEILKQCGSMYSKLCTESRAINDAFAWQFLLILPGFFVEIVLKSYNICQTVKNKTPMEPITIISDLIHFLVVLEIVIPCVAVKEESIKFVDTLVKVHMNCGNDADFEEVMSSLMLQAHHQKIEFSANGVFSLDGTLIYSILGALTTYLVILLQFDI